MKSKKKMKRKRMKKGMLLAELYRLFTVRRLMTGIFLVAITLSLGRQRNNIIRRNYAINGLYISHWSLFHHVQTNLFHINTA